MVEIKEKRKEVEEDANISKEGAVGEIRLENKHIIQEKCVKG